MSEPPCPNCGSTSRYKRAGIEVRGVFDGVLAWWCQECDHAWPRFPVGPLHDAGLEAVARMRNES